MVPNRPLFVALAIGALFWKGTDAQFANGFDNSRANGYSCPPGLLPLNSGNSDTAPIVCDQDPCYNDVIGCGPGNVCTIVPTSSIGGYFFQHDCQCKPPYVKGTYTGYKGIGTHTSCYIPGQEVCYPNPCQNGGVCGRQTGDNGEVIDFTCNCPAGFGGKTCLIPTDGGFPGFPKPVLTSQPSGPPASSPPSSGSQGVCGSGAASAFPTRCYFNNDPQGRYVCCDSAGCDGFNPPDFLFPHCKANGYVPPGFGVGASPSPPAITPPAGPPSSSQGVCGTGDASFFPTRCWFNNDPQGRYVCCDGQGCDGFNSDNLTPHCKNYGFVPPNFGAGGSPAPPTTPPSGSQGVCGTGAAASFPVRCYYNNDPQGRYVCCDSEGCDGFNPPDNFFPHCKANGYVPPSL